MEGFWRGLWQTVWVAFATLLGFGAGELKQQHKQVLADEKQKVKELKTDAKNTKDVAALSDAELDAELRDPPRR